MSRIEKGIVDENEITPEARRRSWEFIMNDINASPDSRQEDFSVLFDAAIKKLPRYRELVDRLGDVPSELLGYEVFKLLRKSSDPADVPQGRGDGVLIFSMKTGRLECAGRVAIAAAYLRERQIPHAVLGAPGHSLLLVGQDSTTLAYVDPNNDLYFSFPREALRGFKDFETPAKIVLQSFTPRPQDIVDGRATVFTELLVMSSHEGVGRQYLGNVRAALDGSPEFTDSSITVDREASEAVAECIDEYYGRNAVIEDFINHTKSGKVIEQEKRQKLRRKVKALYRGFPSRNEFDTAFAAASGGSDGELLPYLQHAREDQKKEFGGIMWDTLQDPRLLKEELGKTE